MHSPVHIIAIRQLHEEIPREVAANRLAKEPRAGRGRQSSLIARMARLVRLGDGTPGDGPRARESEVVVRWGLVEDEEKVAALLQLNGMPSRIAAGNAFLVAEENGEIVAALRYTMESKRLALGLLVADPWRQERRLAVALYAGAKRLARELGVAEVTARITKPGHSYPREAGYRRGLNGWRWVVGIGRQETNHGGGVFTAPAA